jgi:sulfonate transport system ATP-binding protein
VTVARGLPIEAKQLVKGFGATVVLDHLDLAVTPGQFLAIVGRSGCGKSTLLRILSGLDAPTSGLVCVGEARHTGAIAKQARMMFQEPRLLPWASVLANVEVGLGCAGEQPGKRAVDALAAVGLRTRAKDWPSVLSGGQKQRVALARALISRPQFLALDEPLGALDALTRIEMQGLLEKAWLAQGFTAILVTHDVVEALILADRVVVLEAGRIALDVAIPLPRPRKRGSSDLADFEGSLLKRLVRDEYSQAGRAL